MTAFSQASLPLSFCTSEANWIAGSQPASLSCSVALLCLASSVFVKPSVGSQTRIQQLQINSWGFWVLGFVLFFFSGFSLKNVKNGRNWLGLSGGCFLEGPVLSSRPKHLSLASFSSSSCGSPAAGQFVALLSHHCRVLPPPACQRNGREGQAAILTSLEIVHLSLHHVFINRNLRSTHL